jgi:Membrane protein involved in colicin uptake
VRRTLAYLFLTALSLGMAAVSARGQERKDSLVTLVSAKSAQLIERGGQSFRKVTGPARFLHNNTYLLCDSALWNVTTNIIDAVGHVQIIQDRTRLSSGSLQYVVDDDLAKFRGGLVQLEDKDKNTLRTRYLDYNTKDSVAIFQNGASMRDKDGQVIESLYGSYDSKASLFVFNDQVNMYMDTTFVKTSRLEYRSDINTAYFGYGTDMWQDDNMLSANDGWYDRDKELFFFRRNVHLLTKDQETWSDTLYYHRKPNNVEMMGSVELMDTTRNVFALAGRVEYTDSLARVKMTVTPAVMSIDEDKKTAKRDTVWFGADTILYRGIKRHRVDSLWKVDADKRLKDLTGDPVTEYRRKAAEAAAKAAADAEKDNPNAQAGRDRGPGGAQNRGGAAKPTTGAPATPGDPATPPVDTSGLNPANLLPPPDSLATEPAVVDTTQLSFIWATSRVKLFRHDMQMSCDSLVYYDLDSLVRLYRDPLVFSDGNRQYAADSIYLVIKDRKADRARLMSNAFITTQEDTICYDQIKGAEMMAYFDTTRTLRRFDALGGATALFFLTENNALATVNKVESKMLYALFDQGNLDKIYYFDNAKNDAYPVVQLPADERYMKGFRWEPERRPNGGSDITPLVPRKSQRTSYLARPHAQFKETEIYFPGHIKKIYKDIAYRDSMAVVKARQPKEKPVEAPAPPEPKATTPVDTTAAPPALSAADEALRNELDSQVDKPVRDSLGVAPERIPREAAPVRDSLATVPALENATEEDVQPAEAAPAPDPQAAKKAAERAAREAEKARKAEEKAAQKAERDRIAAEKRAEKEAKWAEQDRKYEEKQEAKRQKALEKERKKKLRILKNLEKKAQKERRIFERYLEQERVRAEKKAAREAEKAARAAEKADREAEKAARAAEKQDSENPS